MGMHFALPLEIIFQGPQEGVIQSVLRKCIVKRTEIRQSKLVKRNSEQSPRCKLLKQLKCPPALTELDRRSVSLTFTPFRFGHLGQQVTWHQLWILTSYYIKQ